MEFPRIAIIIIRINKVKSPLSIPKRQRCLSSAISSSMFLPLLGSSSIVPVFLLSSFRAVLIGKSAVKNYLPF